MKVEAGTSGIGPSDLKPLGELRGFIAWTILLFAETTCRDKEAKMELLVHETDDIIRRVRESNAAPTPQEEEAGT